MADKVFTGFTPQTIQFLKDLEENNNKEWFDANRTVYEQELRDPFKELINYLAPMMATIEPDFELRPHRAISRINRDIRFSKNKDPYKTCLWMSFQIPVSSENWVSYPGFFMELKATGYIYGMGLANPKRAIMDDFRDNVMFRAEEFQEMTQQTVLDRGFRIMGDEYKRPLANSLSEYFQPWIQRKHVWVMKEKPVTKALFSTEFANEMRDDFKALEWLFNFLKESQPE